jgi:hypothetical protein
LIVRNILNASTNEEKQKFAGELRGALAEFMSAVDTK